PGFSRCGRGGVVAHVRALARRGRTYRAAIDAGRHHGNEEFTVEARIAAETGTFQCFAVEVEDVGHTSHNTGTAAAALAVFGHGQPGNGRSGASRTRTMRTGNRGRDVSAVIGAFLLTFAGLFPIVNPIEAAPFFLALTPEMSDTERTALARRIAINGFALLLGSMVLGPWLLVFFGIDLPVVRIAGGLVVTALGWKLLTEEEWSDHGEASVQPGVPRRIGAFYPLTMPLTVGPGSISVAITIGSRKPEMAFGLPDIALHAVGALIGVVAIALSIYIAY